MQKRKLNNQGFGLVGVLVVVLVVVAIGGAGYFVWQKNHDDKLKTAQNSKTDNNESTTATTAPTFNKLPENWTEYKNDANGLRLGYPTEWGVLDIATLHTPNYTNVGKNLDGQFAINFSKKDGFSAMAQKYGATIKPAADGKSWIVTDENPAAVDGYKIGDSYKTISKPVNGGNAIDLSFTDEECQYTHFVLELKQSYADIGLPKLCAFETSPITDENRAAYTKLISDFLKTITVY